MVYQLISIVYQALKAAFGMASEIFSATGIALVTAITVMVLISAIIRMFTARFVGQQIVQGQERQQRLDDKKRRETSRKEAAHRKSRRN